jgi:hypothetical protein
VLSFTSARARIENPDPLVNRGAAPDAVRLALYDIARGQGGNMLPTIR